LKFRRQHPIGPWIVDFYCAEAKLAVEVDGRVHEEWAERDRRRTRWLADQGIRVIRLAAEDVRVNLDPVLDFIARTCRARIGG
jgi:very-short-patch-repair endonuclease